MSKRKKDDPALTDPDPTVDPVGNPPEEEIVPEEESPPVPSGKAVDVEALEQCQEKVRKLEAKVAKLEALAEWAEQAMTPVFKYLRIRPPKRPE